MLSPGVQMVCVVYNNSSLLKADILGKVLSSCGDDGTVKLFHPPKFEPLR